MQSTDPAVRSVPVAFGLRAKVAVLLVLVSLLPLALAACIDISRTRAQLVASTQSLLRARAEELVRELDSFHRSHQRTVSRIAGFPDTARVCNSGGADEARGRLAGIFTAFPASDAAIGGVGVLDLSGKVILASNKALDGVDLAFRPHVQLALKGQSVISDIHLTHTASGEWPAITYLSPVRDANGGLACVAMILVRATSLWERMRASNGLGGEGSFAVLFDAHGVRVGHSYSDDIVFRPAGELEAAEMATMVNERRFGAATRALLKEVRPFPEQFTRARATTPDLSFFKGFAPVNGTENYGIARRFETVPWTMFYMVPISVVDAQIAGATRQLIGLAAVITVAALSIGALLATRILRPIRQLTTAAATLAAGDLSARVPEQGADELGQLGRGFNRMAERLLAQSAALQRSHDELEQRVEDRTAQLRAEAAERERAQAETNASQRLLQSIADNTLAMIHVKDTQGRYLMANARFVKVHGVEREALLGRTDRDVFGEAAAPVTDAVDRQVMETGRSMTEELTIDQPDGPHTYLSLKAPLWDAQGALQGVFAVSTDISERRRLDEMTVRMAAIVESTEDAIVGKTLSGVITSWNSGAERLFGYKSTEAIGRSIQMLVPEDRADEEPRILARVAAGHTIEHYETVRRRKDGRLVDVSVTISPIRDALGQVIGASKIARDITQRKHDDARLRAQLERLGLLDQITRAIAERQDLQSIYQVVVRSLEERLPVDLACICSHDPLTQMLTVVGLAASSEHLAERLGLAEHTRLPVGENGLSRGVSGELVHEPDLEAVPHPFPQRLFEAGLDSMVISPLSGDGGVSGVLIAARRLRHGFDSGDCEFLRQLSAHVSLAAQQATLYASLQGAYDDLQRNQEASLQQERLRALGQMASGVAHDINNALSPASLYAQSLLEREVGLSERGRSQLESIGHAIDDVAATVARMSDFYRQREPEALHEVDLNRIVQQVAEMTRARWSDMPQQRGIVVQMSLDLADALPATLGIESDLREALVNLVFNAIDAMPYGGMLTLRTRTLEAGVPGAVVEVADTGVGMSDEVRQHCIEPFFTTKGERGTGMGLAMVYGAAQRHGATLDIRSQQGRGTIVSLHFPPVSLSSATGASGALEVAQPADPLRVLLVDDDPMVLRSVREMLELDGHTVAAANGGQAGIDAFMTALSTAHAFQIVITDLGMPYVNGRQVAAVIKRVAPETPVVLLTGWGQRLVDDNELPEHIDAMLGKPARLAELRLALQQQAGRPDATRETP